MKTRLEPIAHFYQRDFDKYTKPYPDGIPVVTLEKAEAYTNKRVNEALTEAAQLAITYLSNLQDGNYHKRLPDEYHAVANVLTTLRKRILNLKEG